MKYRHLSLLLLFLPVIAHAMPFAGPIPGVIEFIILVFVIIPILSIESVIIIIFSVMGKFNNSANVSKSNKVIGLTVTIGLLALLSFIYKEQKFDEGTVLLVLGIIACSLVAIGLPNLQLMFYRKHNKSLNQTGAKNAPPG